MQFVPLRSGIKGIFNSNGTWNGQAKADMSWAGRLKECIDPMCTLCLGANLLSAGDLGNGWWGNSDRSHAAKRDPFKGPPTSTVYVDDARFFLVSSRIKVSNISRLCLARSE